VHRATTGKYSLLKEDFMERQNKRSEYLMVNVGFSMMTKY
jgi:hypothetical protein